MTPDKIIENLYKAFEDCARPNHFTDYKHCQECNDHDETMLSVTLHTLNSEHVGQACWNPFSFLSVEGFSHYMPRILELAITGANNKDGDLFLLDILFHLAPEKDYDRFDMYNKSQTLSILDALNYANNKFHEILIENYYDDDMENALRYWELKAKNHKST